MMKSISRFLFGTLRGRLIISVALVHAIMMSFFIIDLTARQRDMLLDRQTEEATALSQALAISSAEWIAANDIAGLQELVDAHSLYPEIIFVFLADKDGRVLAGTDKPRQGQFMLDLPQEARLTIVSRSSSLVDVAVPAMIAGRHVGWARVGIGQETSNAKLAEITRNGGIYTLAAILIGSVIAWFMGSQITRRLYTIQETIAAVRSGNRLARSTLAGDDESAVMAREFDSMLDDLSKRDVELRESETKLQTIFARSQDAIGVSKKGNHIFVNPAYVTIFGYESADELIGTPIINLIAPESREMVIENVQARAQGLPVPSDYETVALRKDGSTFIMDVRVSTYQLQDEQYTLVILRDITERKQAEVALRESELKYRSLIEASSDAIFCVDDKGQYQFTNQLFASTFGKSPEYFIGKTFWDIYPKEHADYRFETTKRVFQTGESESIEVEVPLPDKSLFFYATANPIKDETGKVLLVLTHAVNITNLKNAEAALRKSEERFKALADTSPLAIYASVGIEQQATYINSTFVKLFGYTLEEVPSAKQWWPMAYPDENYRRLVEEEWQRRVSQAIETHSEIEPIEVVVNCKDGSQKNILWGFETLEEENWAFGLDLTERKKAEEELRKSEEKYRTLLQTAMDGFWLADGKGNLLQVNEAYCRMSGYTEQELLTMRITDLDSVETADAATAHIKAIIAKGEDRFETKHCKKDGSLFDVEINVQFKDIEDGRFVVFLQDITERKQSEIVLRESRELLLNAFHKSPLMKSLSDLSTGKYLEVNDSFCGVSEFSREEVIGKTAIEIGWISKDERMRFMQKVLQDGSVNGMEFPLRSKKGKTIIARYWGTIIHTAQGDMLYSAAEDITDRKQAEEALAASREMLNNILDNTRIHLWAFDGTHYIYTNKEWFNYTGQDPNFSLTIERWASAIHPDDVAPSGETWMKNWETKTEHDNYFRLKRYDGIYRDFYCHAVPIFNDKGDFQYFQGFNIDITERKQAEEKMRESEDRFRRLANNAPDIIFRYNFVPEMRLAFINPAVEKITLYTPEECYADPLLMINMAHPDDAMLMAEHLQSRQTPDKPLSMRWLDKQGAIHWMESRLVPIYDEENQLVAVEGITRDITERKQAVLQIEEQIKRLNALHTVDAIIKSSFDLKNTLKVLLDQIAAQLQVDAASILLFNKDLLTLNYSAGYGFRSTAIQHTSLKLGEGFAGHILLNREIIRIPDLTKTDSELAKALALIGEHFISYIGVPLIAKGDAVGVLEIFQRAKPSPNPDWFEFLEMLADQAAIAINNTQLFENLKHSNLELIFAYNATIEGWSRAMDLRDKETEAHTQRVTSLTVQLAGQMGIPEADILHIRRGALLHDIGKIGVPDTILHKSSQLTDEEWKEMCLHPVYAYEMLAPISYLKPALDIPYCHHEKWDGSGYPRGLKGEEIPLAARLFAVVDVFDAVTSDRPYRKAWSKEKTLEYICEQSGKQFDPNIVRIFLQVILNHTN